MKTKLCVCFTPELLILLGRVKHTNSTIVVKIVGSQLNVQQQQLLLLLLLLQMLDMYFLKGPTKRKKKMAIVLTWDVNWIPFEAVNDPKCIAIKTFS